MSELHSIDLVDGAPAPAVHQRSFQGAPRRLLPQLKAAAPTDADVAVAGAFVFLEEHWLVLAFIAFGAVALLGVMICAFVENEKQLEAAKRR